MYTHYFSSTDSKLLEPHTCDSLVSSLDSHGLRNHITLGTLVHAEPSQYFGLRRRPLHILHLRHLLHALRRHPTSLPSAVRLQRRRTRHLLPTRLRRMRTRRPMLLLLRAQSPQPSRS